MKKKFKITLIVFLVVIFGCFSDAFAATKVGTKLKKNVQFSMNKNLLDSSTTDDGAEIGTSNLNGTAENSAQKGSILKNPEIGWKRYNDNNPKIKYIGSSWTKNNTKYLSKAYNGDYHQIIDNIKPTSFVFKFKGTQFRLIGDLWKEYPKYAYISIDGNEEERFDINYNLVNAQFQSVLYSKEGLKDAVHTINVTQKDNSKTGLFFDALDINDSGYLIDPSVNIAEELTLNKYTDSLQIGQSDTLIATVTPDNVTNKTVKWTSSDPSMVTVDENGNIKAIKAGTATITATTTDGSNLSASCVVNVTYNNRCTLTINMVNGSVKQYDLSASELSDFLNWYNGMTNPLSSQCYVFNVPVLGPYVTNKDYIPFNKIDDFKVQEYITK